MKISILLITAALLIPNADASVLWERDLGEDNVNISIVNEHGSIQLAPSTDTTLTISGPNGKITVSEGPSGLQLSVTTPDENSRHTDIKILIPQLSHIDQLNVTTVAGTITSHGLAEMPTHFKTITGHITFIAQPASNFDVVLATSGEIAVDYSIEIEQKWDVEPSKTGHITIGEGGVPVRLESRRGTLSVLRQ